VAAEAKTRHEAASPHRAATMAGGIRLDNRANLHPQRSTAHGRSPSGRVALTRRMTKGPLDADDADDALDGLQDAPTSTYSTHASTPSRSPIVSPPPEASGHGTQENLSNPSNLSLDVSFLQDPSAYHVLPVTAPPPFQQALNTPSVAAPIDSLLLSGHYRLAAIAAARNIVSAAAPTDYPTLFHLVHIRLACLCLVSEHALAAQEAKVLGDLNSAFYRHPLTNAHLVPWDLRLLVVRLTALGYGEWRKGIMGYYELARECRESILRATEESERLLWRRRLRDCGVRVANTLVEMGDLDGAGRHLATLSESTADADANSTDTRDVRVMEALVWLRVGDLASARRSLAHASDAASDALLDGALAALVQLADSDYEAAASSFRALHDQHPDDAMIAQNLAVCLLYTGHIPDARHLLSDLVDKSPPFHSLVFNLSTVFELCTERNRDKKAEIADKLASRKDGGGVGWERSALEFKL
jgi:tetratricopeptide (TPR) repeat protein